MTFSVGQIVECVNDSSDWLGRPLVVVKGVRYTVTDVFDDIIRLAGVDPGVAPGWWSGRFRPVVELGTDISVFHEILRKQTTPALV